MTTPARPPRRRAQPEAALQRAIVGLIRQVGIRGGGFVFHVPNGGKRSEIEAKIMKGMGVVAGISDLVLVVPPRTAGIGGAEVYFLECKAPGGSESPAQKAHGAACESVCAPRAVVETIEEAVWILNCWGILARKVTL